MKGFISNFLIEYKKHLYRVNMIAWLIILVILLYMAMSTVNVIKHNPDKIAAFKKIQTEYFKGISNYEFYKFFGIDILYVIPATSFISNETTIPDDLSIKTDAYSKVQISNNFKGKVLFSQGKGIKPCISIIIKLLLSMMALWYGFEIVQNMEFSKSLASILSSIKSFLYTTVSKFILLCMTFLLVMGIVLLYIWSRGITFRSEDFSVISGFLFNALVFLGIFFSMGALFGLFSNKKAAIFLISITWFIINIASYWLIIPSVETGLPDALKEYQTMVNKWIEINNFEILVTKEHGKFDRKNLKEAQKVIEYFWNNYYPKKIAPLEKKLRDMMASSIEKDRRISKFFPGLFFDMTANEASGRGYESYLRFYDYSMQLQSNFIRFIIDRTFYNDPKVMVNFIKDDEDIFYGKAALPPNFWSGELIQLGYLAILIFACYICYQRKMFPRPKNEKALDSLTIKLKSRENITIVDYSDDNEDNNVRIQLVNESLGKRRIKTWKLTLDDKPLGKEGIEEILYIPKPRGIPRELKGKHLVRFFKGVLNLSDQAIAKLEIEIGKEELNKFFRKMNIEKQAKLILSLFFLAGRRYYLTNNFHSAVHYSHLFKIGKHAAEHQPKDSMIINLHNIIFNRWMEEKNRILIYYDNDNGKYFTEFQESKQEKK